MAVLAMRSTDYTAFQALVTELSAARGREVAHDLIRGGFKLLEDLKWEDVRRALEYSARHDPYFPDAVRVRRAVSRSREEKARQPLRPDVANALALGERHCPACEDTGWAYHERFEAAKDGPKLTVHQLANFVNDDRERLLATWGHDVPVYPRGRMKTWVEACPCRATNSIYQAKRDQEHRKTHAGEDR